MFPHSVGSAGGIVHVESLAGSIVLFHRMATGNPSCPEEAKPLSISSHPPAVELLQTYDHISLQKGVGVGGGVEGVAGVRKLRAKNK